MRHTQCRNCLHFDSCRIILFCDKVSFYVWLLSQHIYKFFCRVSTHVFLSIAEDKQVASQVLTL
jgi:hypothetical protein